MRTGAGIYLYIRKPPLLLQQEQGRFCERVSSNPQEKRLNAAVFLVLTAVSLVEAAEHLRFLVVVIRVDFVYSVHEGRIIRAEGALGLGVSESEVVQLLRHLSACILERNRVAFGINRAERLVNLDEGTIRHLLDNAGFNTVLENLRSERCKPTQMR